MYVTPKSLKGWHKNAISLFVPVKFNFSRKKSATTFLCVKSSSGNVVATSFPYPTVHRSMAGDVPIYLKLVFKVTHPFKKRRFPKLSFESSSAVTAGTGTFCDKYLAQRILFLAICHLWRYSKGITPSEGVKWLTSDCEVAFQLLPGIWFEHSLFIDCGCAVRRFCPNMSLQQIHARIYLYISAKLSPVCPAKCNANSLLYCVPNLWQNKFDLIWFDLIRLN